jgi:hypothetical protein
MTISSVTIDGVSGTVELEFFGTHGERATTKLSGSNSLSFEPETLALTALSTNTDLVTVFTAGAKLTVLPGETVILLVEADAPIAASIEVAQGIIDANPDTALAEELTVFIAKLQTAIEELDKIPPNDLAAVRNIEKAVADLEAAVAAGLLDPAQGTQLMDELAGVARQLATKALDEAIAQGGNPDKINEGEQARTEGDTLRALRAFASAVDKYKDAIRIAERA